jgi:diaminopimelate epimerase
MVVNFCKYEGAGNDFILVDDRKRDFPSTRYDLVKHLCDRRFGIGADGLMLLQSLKDYDFSMVYYNADGNEGSMCGNGGRCIAAFSGTLGITGDKARFMAVDGEHQAELISPDYVRLNMQNVISVETGPDYYVLDTGSPHYVTFLSSIESTDVLAEGRKIRYSGRFRDKGINVNYVEDRGDHIVVRTYERGVENETLACGTGVVAAVICSALRKKHDNNSYSMPVKVSGGLLKVSYSVHDGRFTDIWLEGPATFVFEGKIEID